MGYVGDDEMIKGEEGIGGGGGGGSFIGGGGIHLSICPSKIPKHWQPYSFHRFDRRKDCTQVGTGTALTVATVPSQGRAPRVSSEGQCSKRTIN